MARVRVTNESARDGVVWVDDGDHDDDGRPPRVKPIAAGASMELAICQGGMLLTSGFKVRVRVLAHNPRKPAPPQKTKARRRAQEA